MLCVDRKDTAVKALRRNGFCGYTPFLKRQTAEYPLHGRYSAVHLLIHRFPAQSVFVSQHAVYLNLNHILARDNWFQSYIEDDTAL